MNVRWLAINTIYAISTRSSIVVHPRATTPTPPQHPTQPPPSLPDLIGQPSGAEGEDAGTSLQNEF
jgi:hypothetical protein